MMSHLAQPSVRLSVVNVVDYPPGASYGPRTLGDFELVWLQSGSAVWTCSGNARDLPAGSLLLARPGMRDRFAWDPARVTRHAYIHFALPDGPETGGWPLVRHLSHDDPLAAMFRYALWLAGAAPANWRSRAEEVVGVLVAAFASGPLPGDEQPPLPAAIEAVGDYLWRQWSSGVTRPVPLAELAGAAALSTVQVSRIFRARFGIGPVAAVERLRLSRAEGLLSRSNLSVAEIAAECGFSDAYHFSRRFRAVNGCSPRQFRAAESPPSAAADLFAWERHVWRQRR